MQTARCGDTVNLAAVALRGDMQSDCEPLPAARLLNVRIVAALLTFTAIALLADWLGWGHQWHGLAALVCWFFLLRMLPPRGWRILFAAFLWLSVAIAALACIQIWFMPRARGPFASPNFLGAYAVLMFFLALARPRSHLDLAIYANLASVLLSQSRGSILALGAGLVVMYGRRRPVLAAFCAGGALIAVLCIRAGIDEARFGLWRVGFIAALQRPILGWGQGGLSISGWNYFYNLPLDWLLNAGILGVAAGCWLLIEAVRVAKDTHRISGAMTAEGVVGTHTSRALLAFLAAWLVNSLVIFQTPATLIPVFAVLAYLSKAKKSSETTYTARQNSTNPGTMTAGRMLNARSRTAARTG